MRKLTEKINELIKMLLVAVFCFAQTVGYGQNPLDDILKEHTGPPSPNAASLGQYGDMPVSLYTGSPNINIPLYNIQSKSLAMPVSLNYHPSGIKVQQVASWVGLGWSLNAGGVITRKVNDLPDDAYLNYYTKATDFVSPGNSPPLYTATNAGYLYQGQAEINALNNTTSFNTSNNAQLYDIASGFRDTEPDVYYFNIGGNSGKFVFDENGLPRLLSDNSDLRIDYNLSSSSAYPKGEHAAYIGNVNFKTEGAITDFTITTTDGTKYVFATPELSVSKAQKGFPGCQNFVLDNTSEIFNAYYSAWYLTKIVSVNETDEIVINYDNELSLSHNFTDYSTTLVEGTVIPAANLSFDPRTIGFANFMNTGSSFSFTFSKRLSSIVWDKGSVEFVAVNERLDVSDNYSVNAAISQGFTKAKSLDKIYIRNESGYTYKSFALTYDYFAKSNVGECDQAEAENERLKLLSVKERGALGTTDELPPYQFDYDNTPMPSRHSLEQDFWGYYNGNGEVAQVSQTTGNPSLNFIPTVYAYPDDQAFYSKYLTQYSVYPRTNFVGSEYILQGANRLPNPSLMKAGMLKTITYPTGGQTSFEFEPHKFMLEGDEFVGGGLRIKKITTSESLNATNKTVREFVYSKANHSSGKTVYLPHHAYQMVSGESTTSTYYDDYIDWKFNNLTGQALIEGSTFRFARSVGNIGETNGSHIAYEQVKTIYPGNGYEVSQFDLTGTYGENMLNCNNGDCVYEQAYSIIPFSLSGVKKDHFPFASSPNFDWKRGSLLSKTTYDQNDKVRERTILDYEIGEYTKIPAIKLSTIGLKNGHTGNLLHTISYLSKYYFLSGWNRLKSKTVETYSEDGVAFLPVTTEYSYGNNHKQIVEEEMTNSDQTTYITNYTYPLDYVTASTNSSNSYTKGVALLIVNNQVATPVERLQSLQYPGGPKRVFSGSLNLYRENPENVGQVVIDQMLRLNTDQSIEETTFTKSTVNNNVLIWDSRYSVEGKANVFDERGNLLEFQRPNDAPQSLIWGEKGSRPVAKIINGKIANSAYTSFEEEDYSRASNGGWEITHGNISGNYGGWNHLLYKTGMASFNLGIYKFVKKTITDAGKYKLSFWHRGPVKYRTANTTFITVSPSGSDWEYFETVVDVGANEALEIRGSVASTLIDELRLYPKDAFMQTFCYDKINQALITVTNEAGMSDYFQYDGLQRLRNVLDKDGNLLNHIDYNYQSGAKHNIRKYEFKTAGIHPNDDFSSIPIENKMESVDYFDGLGRVVQHILVAQSPRKFDVVQLQDYDQYGRSTKDYLPFSLSITNNNGAFDPIGLDHLNYFYQNQVNTESETTNPYKEKRFDKSPLNRVVESAAQGDNWKLSTGHTKKSFHSINSVNEVKRFDLASGNLLGYYPAGVLLKLEIINEKGQRVINYSNKLGQVIASKLQLTQGDFAETYTLFDEFGNSVVILPPEAIKLINDNNLSSFNHPEVDKLIYRYTYDNRKRLIEKKVPGVQSIHFIYDQLDRLVMVQDGVDRGDYKWRFTKYDVLGRKVYTGRLTSIDNRSVWQQRLNTSTNSLFEEKHNVLEDRATDLNNTNSIFGYTKRTLPELLNSYEVLTVKYYDDYNFDGIGEEDITYVNTLTENTGKDFYRIHGVVTGSLLKVLSSDNTLPQYLRTVSFYDDRGRTIQIHAENHLGGADITSMTYNFTSQPLKTLRQHQTSAAAIETMERYEYDHRGVMNKVWHKVGNQEEVLLSSSFYNELGQLSEKNLHSTTKGDNFLQSIDYGYNVRGWLKYINDVTNLKSSMDEGSSPIDELVDTEIRLRYKSTNGNLGTDVIKVETEFTEKQAGQITAKTDSKTIDLNKDGNTSDTLVDEATIDLKDKTITAANMDQVLSDLESSVQTELQAKGIIDQNQIDEVVSAVKNRYRDKWLSLRINAGHDDNDDIFAMYFHHDLIGNVENMQWRVAPNDFRSVYDFEYDKFNRLVKGDYREFTDQGTYQAIGNYNVSNLSYDHDGNILSVTRKGKLQGGMYGITDELQYAYSGNQLASVEDASGSLKGFKESSISSTSSEYQYDANGNMIKDDNKGITIAYNHLNLPETITKIATGNTIHLTYDAVGIKLRKTVTYGHNNTATKDYVSGFEYADGELEGIYHQEGRLTRFVRSTNINGTSNYGYNYEYALKDHLGNTRVLFSDRDRDGLVEVTENPDTEIVQQEHYYPFGMRMEGDWNVIIGSENKYLYNGKEFNDDLGLDLSDYGARWYDASIGRWHSVDPLADRFMNFTPYNYGVNNPIKFIDPDGRAVVPSQGFDSNEDERTVYQRKLEEEGFPFSENDSANGPEKNKPFAQVQFIAELIKDEKVVSHSIYTVPFEYDEEERIWKPSELSDLLKEHYMTKQGSDGKIASLFQGLGEYKSEFKYSQEVHFGTNEFSRDWKVEVGLGVKSLKISGGMGEQFTVNGSKENLLNNWGVYTWGTYGISTKGGEVHGVSIGSKGGYIFPGSYIGVNSLEKEYQLESNKNYSVRLSAKVVYSSEPIIGQGILKH